MLYTCVNKYKNKYKIMEKNESQDWKEMNNIKSNFRYPRRVHTLLLEKANAEGITLSELVRRLFEDGIKK